MTLHPKGARVSLISPQCVRGRRRPWQPKLHLYVSWGALFICSALRVPGGGRRKTRWLARGHLSHLRRPFFPFDDGGGLDRVVFDSLEELLLLTLYVSLVCNDVTVGYIWWYLLMFLGIIVVVTVLAICRS